MVPPAAPSVKEKTGRRENRVRPERNLFDNVPVSVILMKDSVSVSGVFGGAARQGARPVMGSGEDSLRTLREAVDLSPENVPLRQHLADSLLRLGRADEAEKEYRHALTLAPHNERLKLGLADAFFRQGKYSQAIVVVETLTRLPTPPPRAHLLYARLLHQAGDLPRATSHYRAAVEAAPELADHDLEVKLGLAEAPQESTLVQERTSRERQRQGSERQGVPDDAPHASKSESADLPVERPAVTFADVGGMYALKDEIRAKIIDPLTHPEVYAAYGKTIGGGILLYGPPGCGKTYLARATAGEVKAGFVAVGIDEVLDMWVGQSERNLHGVFACARANTPCVLFFDEVDALGGRRSDHRHSGVRQVINQFLAEMDGVADTNKGVLILAATNAPWDVDSAFRRPGRFDRILFVPPPDATARAAILRLLCRGKPLDNIDYDLLGRKTEGFSGADLKGMVDLAVEAKLREAIRSGAPRPLTTRDLLEAVASSRPSTQEWFATARNYALYANQGGLYDDILKYLKL
jgi:SpoVK/Ycf46/Vps4 family AAA+-type ATPase